jgi:hypothetical protein
MTPIDIQHVIHDIVVSEIDPDVIRASVTVLLAGFPTDDETIGAVLHEAREQARARHKEFQMLSGDIERVVGVMDGVIEPAIAWLEANGLPDARRHLFGREWWRR